MCSDGRSMNFILVYSFLSILYLFNLWNSFHLLLGNHGFFKKLQLVGFNLANTVNSVPIALLGIENIDMNRSLADHMNLY